MQTIMWRQDNKQLNEYDINTQLIPLSKPIWHKMEGGDADIMLKGKVPVIVKTGDMYRTNNAEVAAQYQAKGKRVEICGQTR